MSTSALAEVMLLPRCASTWLTKALSWLSRALVLPRAFESAAANLKAFDPYIDSTQLTPVARYLVDAPTLKALHMINGDPARTMSFTMFSQPDYFFETFSPCPSPSQGCLNDGFAYIHGDYSNDIGQTWLGVVGPGVKRGGLDDSPWTDEVDYVDMARLVAAELEELGEPVTLVGHSMGGKVAMQVALRRPELVRALVVVDIAPVEYPVAGSRTDDPDEELSPFAAYIAAMKAMDLERLGRRDEADEALRAAVPSRMVRSFLLQSLVREGLGTDGSWRWRLNLDLLERDLDRLRGFPDPPPDARFDGPVLWIAGANSHYVLDRDRERMEDLFPHTRLVRIKHAGHWVHSEQPEVFLETIRRFLAQVERA